MATSKDTAALKVQYKSPLDINENQVSKAIEIMQSQAMPHDLAAEIAVIGVILQANNDSAESVKNNSVIAQIIKVRNMLKPKDFYDERHQIIYQAVCNLIDTRKKLDLITIFNELRRMGKVEEAGGHMYLVECTNTVGSSLHAIQHAGIVMEMSLRRSAILANYLANTRLFDMGADVYETRNELADDLRVMPITSYLVARTANERMQDGKAMPKLKNMAGSLWKKGEMVFLFAGPKRGKSIFAVQIADAVSKGEGMFGGLLVNECEPQKIGYIDFELQDNEFYERYSNDKGSYEFSDNLIFINENIDFNEYGKSMENIVFQAIEEAVLSLSLDAIVVDNITWMANMTTSDTQAALELMKKLDHLKKRTGISMLILAHTPKINGVVPITEDSMGGSKMLSNFAQGVVGIGKSAIAPDILYIKECVRRNGQSHFDEDNVIQVSRGMVDGFLGYEYMQLTPENLHLSDPNDAETKLLLVKDGANMRKSSPKSYQQIYDELQIKTALGWSYKQFTRKVKEELERTGSALLYLDDAPAPDKVTAPFSQNGHQVTEKADTNDDIPF